jgi:hypothetical protein
MPSQCLHHHNERARNSTHHLILLHSANNSHGLAACNGGMRDARVHDEHEQTGSACACYERQMKRGAWWVCVWGGGGGVTTQRTTSTSATSARAECGERNDEQRRGVSDNRKKDQEYKLRGDSPGSAIIFLGPPYGLRAPQRQGMRMCSCQRQWGAQGCKVYRCIHACVQEAVRNRAQRTRTHCAMTPLQDTRTFPKLGGVRGVPVGRAQGEQADE